ncbi:probable carboxylesterase 18 isoform X2 [Oryza brachyantha]|nr:probable carboxylesterase 18 isoform X2 [Oryza brachyantha]
MADEHGGRRRVALPWAVRIPLCLLEAAIDASQRRDGSVNRSLFALFDRCAAANPRPDAAGVSSRDVTVDVSRGLRARVFTPPVEGRPLPVIVYFHGGGFSMFSAASRPFDAHCRNLCGGAGAVVVSVDYRLAPEHRFPAAYDDGEAVLRYLGASGLLPDEVDLSACFLAGDSAGGNIAHHVAQRWTASTAPPSENPVHLAGVILLEPFFGGEERTSAERALDGVAPVVNIRRSDRWWKAFLPEGADRNHPAVHVTGDAGPEPELTEAFPPAMVVVGGHDPLQDWGRRYACMLEQKGKAVRVVELPEAIHAFYLFPELAGDNRKLVDEIRAFVEESIIKGQVVH